MIFWVVFQLNRFQYSFMMINKHMTSMLWSLSINSLKFSIFLSELLFLAFLRKFICKKVFIWEYFPNNIVYLILLKYFKIFINLASKIFSKSLDIIFKTKLVIQIYRVFILSGTLNLINFFRFRSKFWWRLIIFFILTIKSAKISEQNLYFWTSLITIRVAKCQSLQHFAHKNISRGLNSAGLRNHYTLENWCYSLHSRNLMNCIHNVTENLVIWSFFIGIIESWTVNKVKIFKLFNVNFCCHCFQGFVCEKLLGTFRF